MNIKFSGALKLSLQVAAANFIGKLNIDTYKHLVGRDENL